MSAPTDARAPLTDRLDAWLPQTQCTQCGYPSCRAYAEALAEGRAAINQCPPGGDVTLRALGDLLRIAPMPLDPRFGAHHPRAVAVIDESLCIGCRKCIDACPVDAILGARKLMHTVIARDCTGCELCLPPCPVDCIALAPAAPERSPGPWPDYARAETDRWREHAERRRRRQARGRRARRAGAGDAVPPIPGRERMRAEIRAAVERVRAKKRGAGRDSSS